MAKSKSVLNEETVRRTVRTPSAVAQDPVASVPFEPNHHSESQSPQQFMDSCEEAIRELAFLKWEEAGCPSGDGFDFWLEAEREVMTERS